MLLARQDTIFMVFPLWVRWVSTSNHCNYSKFNHLLNNNSAAAATLSTGSSRRFLWLPLQIISLRNSKWWCRQETYKINSADFLRISLITTLLMWISISKEEINIRGLLMCSLYSLTRAYYQGWGHHHWVFISNSRRALRKILNCGGVFPAIVDYHLYLS